ncbi:7074_t:CDS:1 [Paraglomus brasilianum]|uniref:Fucosyltransferase n=1 Tax=Paraglomus brasilianum TaxID=144538 RepID=A0A9N8VJD8_9GLOM|nr:7074_t:CDS:1 [Paraglomus brasilianum]
MSKTGVGRRQHAWKLLAVTVILMALITFSLNFMDIYSSTTVPIIEDIPPPQPFDNVKLAPSPFLAEYAPTTCDTSLHNSFPRYRTFRLRGPRNREVLIFRWLHYAFTTQKELSWPDAARDLCPYPPELAPSFQRIFGKFAPSPYSDITIWPAGYAPCFFWTHHGSGEQGTCEGGTSWRITMNFTLWREADVMLVDFPYLLREDYPPYYDLARFPPKNTNQVWWLKLIDEGLAYEWYAGLRGFRELFEMTMGPPARVFDIFQPTFGIARDRMPAFYNTVVPFEKKKSDVLVAWMSGNCYPKNNRNEFVADLMKYTSVDSYGSCHHTKDVPEYVLEKYGVKPEGNATAHWQANMFEVKRDTLSPYKFILALENSNCMGYVTEKVYDPILIDAIPIYMGAPDIDAYVPPHSIIKVTDFKTVKEVADYIEKVANNKTLYESYFEWKKDKTYNSFCEKCWKGDKSYMCKFLERAEWVDES